MDGSSVGWQVPFSMRCSLGLGAAAALTLLVVAYEIGPAGVDSFRARPITRSRGQGGSAARPPRLSSCPWRGRIRERPGR